VVVAVDQPGELLFPAGEIIEIHYLYCSEKIRARAWFGLDLHRISATTILESSRRLEMDSRKAAFAASALAMLLAATSVLATGEHETPTASARPAQLDITTIWYFGNPQENLGAKREFEEYILERFDVKLSVNVLPGLQYMDQVALAVSSGLLKGIVMIYGGTYIEDYFRDGATVALNDLVAGNENWQALPSGMRDDNVRDGKLLAMPSAWQEGLGFVRAIRVDWLDNLGIKLPSTIDEFHEACVAFTNGDPDGNGKDDTFAMTSAGVWNLQDIFMSFGVPTNHVGDHCITPDPHDGFRFNDGMLKPGMKAALEWLERAYREGLLDVELFTNTSSDFRSRITSGMYGSTYYWANWVLKGAFERRTKVCDPEARFDMILGLTSDWAQRAVNLGGMQTSGSPYVLIKGTERPEEQVQAFIDTFLTDEIGALSGRWGIFGKHWEFGEGREIVKLVKSEQDDVREYFPFAGIVGEIMPLLTQLRYPLRREGEDPSETAARHRSVQREADSVNAGIESGILYRHPNHWKEPQSERYAHIHVDIKRIFKETVARAIAGIVPVISAIEEYRSHVGALGGQQVLDEANAAIGKTSSEIYRY
jgi:ABC-type glycerol-3-phosphate transport system substrate-binding protein